MISYNLLFFESIAMLDFLFFCPFVHALRDHPEVHFGRDTEVFLEIKLETLTIFVL